MKKNNFTLRLFLICCCIGFFTACSDDDSNFGQFESSENSIKTAGDSKYDILGYGYDISKPFVSLEAVRNYQIIDIASLINSETPGSFYFDQPIIASTEQRVFGGNNFYSYTETIKTTTNFSGSVASNGILKEATKGMFSAEAKRSQERGYSNAYSSSYSYASAEVLRKYKRLFLDANLELIRRHLTPYFQSRLSTVNNASTAYALVETFGTHILLDVTIGGSFRSDFKSLLIEESTTITRKNNAENSAKYTLAKIGLGASVGWTQESTIQSVQKNLNWKNTIVANGGSTGGMTITTSPTQGTSYSIGIGTWEASINTGNARLVDLDWNKTFPIYEIISDQTQQQLVREAVNRYLLNNTPKEINTKPLHRYWNRKYLMFYPTKIYGESKMTSDWKYEGILGYALESNESGTVALHRYWNQKYKMFYLTPTYGESKMTKDWSYDGIIGYAYSTQVSGTVPLYRYWNKKYTMFYFTTAYGESRMTKDWSYDGIIGYIYPSDVSCIDRDKNPNQIPVPNIMQ